MVICILPSHPNLSFLVVTIAPLKFKLPTDVFSRRENGPVCIAILARELARLENGYAVAHIPGQPVPFMRPLVLLVLRMLAKAEPLTSSQSTMTCGFPKLGALLPR